MPPPVVPRLQCFSVHSDFVALFIGRASKIQSGVGQRDLVFGYLTRDHLILFKKPPDRAKTYKIPLEIYDIIFDKVRRQNLMLFPFRSIEYKFFVSVSPIFDEPPKNGSSSGFR